MNTKIALSTASIVASVAIVAGATFAFFSDTETSSNNLFQAGALDLKIDNTSYYNGVLSQNTSWGLDDLPGHLFFDFRDIKPGDEGEDTISLHVNDNNAWACADFKITKDDDISSTEPELTDGDAQENLQDPNDGELGKTLNFVFWTDDGDNVLEDNERPIASDSASTVLNTKMTLADSLTNNVGGLNGDPLTGGKDYFIGKGWCFGNLTLDPVPAGQGKDPTVNSGVLCDGSQLNNITQTDQLMGDVTFYAEQSRNNPNFLCTPVQSPSPSPTPTPEPT